MRRPPMYEFAFRDYAILAAATAALGGALGVIGAFVLPVGLGGFLFLTLAVLGGSALGGGVAEVLQRATRYKRGPVMQAAAATAFVMADVIRLVLAGGLELIVVDLAATLLLAIAVVVAWGRLR